MLVYFLRPEFYDNYWQAPCTEVHLDYGFIRMGDLKNRVARQVPNRRLGPVPTVERRGVFCVGGFVDNDCLMSDGDTVFFYVLNE
jgi:hypothetical protein